MVLSIDIDKVFHYLEKGDKNTWSKLTNDEKLSVPWLLLLTKEIGDMKQ